MLCKHKDRNDPLTSFVDGGIQLTRHARDMLLQAGMFKHAPQLRIIMDMARIQIIANCPFEQSGILGDDGKTSPKIEQADC